ncbi:MAG: hypothetical protein FWF08_05485 [Oscillospiraceae bacterium]|nr:hypothetical protein [Oscillospiraceae bacterium]
MKVDKKIKAILLILTAGVCLITSACVKSGAPGGTEAAESASVTAAIAAETSGFDLTSAPQPENSLPAATIGQAPSTSALNITATPIIPQDTAIQITATETATEEPSAAVLDMTKDQLLSYFNECLNRIKTEKPGFTKSSLMKLNDLKISANLPQAMVDAALYKIFKRAPDTVTVEKGSAAEGVMPVVGKNYVSALETGDIKDISVALDEANGGNYIITVLIKDPAGTGSPYDKIFDYMTLNKMNGYIEQIEDAYVASGSVSLSHYDSRAEIAVDKDGHIMKYTQTINGSAKIKQAELMTFTADWEFFGTTEVIFSGFIW